MCRPAMACQHTMHRPDRIQVPRVPDMLGRRNLSTTFHFRILELGCFRPTMPTLQMTPLGLQFFEIGFLTSVSLSTRNVVLICLKTWVFFDAGPHRRSHKQTQTQDTLQHKIGDITFFNDGAVVLPSFRPLVCRTGL